MRSVMLVLLAMSVFRCGADAGCPSLCSCRSGAGGRPEGEAPSAPEGEPPPGEPLRLRCGPSPAQITELKEIDFTNISDSVISLNLSGNAISTLSRELHLPNLQKLDLSRNRIALIESDAFYKVSGLVHLDLSHNRIASVSRAQFVGLARLERLRLAGNRLAALPSGALDRLPRLKLLDIAENPLVCDCALAWLGAWHAAGGARLAPAARCAAPPALAGRPVRKLRHFLDLARCPPEGAGAGAEPALLLRPAADQLVFEGDALALACAAPLASALHPHELRWAHPSLEACDVNVTSSDVAEAGAAETVAHLTNVSRLHEGAWTCRYSDARPTRLERSLRLVVLGPDTRSCPTAVTEDNRGLYSWPQLLLNRTAAVPCRAGAGSATRRCGADGAWGAADTSRCGYLAEVTKLLRQFALLEPGLARLAALNATARLAALLRARTYPLAEVRDPDDVMFVAQAVDNYMRYLPEDEGLGSALLDVISAAMNVTPGVMALAEARHGACSRLVRAAQRLAAIPSGKQKWNFAVESFPVRPGWGGATCVWYSAAGAGAGGEPRLHCTTTNRTVARLLTFSEAQVHASVQIPASLAFALEGEPAAALVVAVFRDAALFPLLPEDAPADAPHRAKDYYGRSTKREDLNMEITSPVISVQLVNGSLTGEPVEPVVGTLRALGCGESARAAVWDARAQRWQQNSSECRVLHYAGCTAVVALARPGACALLARAERGIFGARTHGARFKPSHPAVYVGSLLLGASLAAAALAYAAAWPALRMPRRAKHAHLNTWLALAALCLLYTLGVYQTEDARLCRALGLAIHYLSLSVLLWLCVAAHVLRREAARARRPPPAPDAPPPPVLGLYLCGWGAALVVVAISGAVSLREYAGYAQCLPSRAAALGALLLPGALLLALLAALLLLARRALRAAGAPSEGTQATEHVELEPWEPAPPAARPARSPSPAAPDAGAGAGDAEHAAGAQLRAQAAVLALFAATWASAAAAVYRPLPAYLPYQEDICSILYAVCATVLGTFILFFHGIARGDVRAQWALMRCYLRRGKRCCRTRSVCDSARARPPPGPPAPGPGPGSGSGERSRSASRGSGGRPDGKAGAELNGHAPPPRDPLKNTNQKTNINLVVLHRRQYRSERSVLAPADAGPGPGPGPGPEAFYNPNQMNVAKKFFKRQRAHVRRNRLGLPPPRRPADADADADADSRRSLPLPARAASLVGAGAKVNNTNIHVEREPRRGPDPNLLVEDEPKTFSCDRAPPRPPGNVYTDAAATRAVSAQCSLERSEPEPEPAPRSASTHTLDTPSERTQPTEPTEPTDRSEPADCATTDTDSFGRYVPCGRAAERDQAPGDISEEGPRPSDPAAAAAADACSTDASEQGFENESDIYCPNYQVSEVSIRSHGLYAPSPASMCRAELGSSAEDVAPAESQYANLEPAWRPRPPPPPRPPPRPRSADSGASDLDELYTRITHAPAPAPAPAPASAAAAAALDLTAHSDVTLRPDSDSCVSCDSHHSQHSHHSHHSQNSHHSQHSQHSHHSRHSYSEPRAETSV